MFRSFLAPLNRRILFFVTSMCAIAICTVIIISTATVILTKESRITELMEKAANSLAVSIPPTFSIAKSKFIIGKASKANPWSFVDYMGIISPEGKILASNGELAFDPQEILTQEKISNSSIIVVKCPIFENDRLKAYILIGRKVRFFGKGLTMVLLLSTISGVIGMFISILVAGKLYKRMLQPLYDLSAAAKEIGTSKDYTLRVPNTSEDELGDLITQFNSMLEQIEKRDRLLTSHKNMLEHAVKMRTAELAKKNAQLVLEVAEREEAEMIRSEVERINQHDLKSLLNLVIGYPEMLLMKGNLTPHQENFIKKIEMAGYRILDMINNNLDIFKMEKGIYKIRATSVNLVHLICEIQDDITSMLTRQNVTLRITFNNTPVSTSNTYAVAGEYRLLQTLFSNLIINAVEASESDDIVTVAIQTASQTVTIHNSTLVPEDMHDKFFNKYATSGKEDGTGLGTYSAKLIANAHNAHIEMSSTRARGTLVTIEFNEQVALYGGAILEPAAQQMLA